MLAAEAFVAAARARGIRLWTGVPCSYLQPFINYVIADPALDYLPASNEGDAVAIAALPVFFTGYSISRTEGIVFLGYYVAYVVFLFFTATEHRALPLFTALMLGFVIPITVITLVVLVAREIRLHRQGGSLLKPVAELTDPSP